MKVPTPGIIFDCDGVLIDSFAANYEAYRRALTLLVSPTLAALFSVSFFRSHWGKPWNEWLPIVAGAHTSEVRRVKAVFYPSCLSTYGRTLPGLAIFRKLQRQHWPVAIVSNGSRSSLNAVFAWLASIGLPTSSTTLCFTPSSQLCPKPAPDLILAARAALGCERCLLIDDRPEMAFEAARSAGIDFLCPSNGHHRLQTDLADWLRRAGVDISLDDPFGQSKPVGIILAAGRGERLYPGVPLFHKPLVDVGGRSAVGWAALALASFVDEILLVVNPHTGVAIEKAVRRELNGRPMAIRLIFQQHPVGVGDAVVLAANAVAEDTSAIVICGDNVLDSDDVMRVGLELRARTQTASAIVGVRMMRFDDAKRYAVLTETGGGAQILVEKPAAPQSPLCWCGPLGFTSLHHLRTRMMKGEGAGVFCQQPTICELVNTYLAQGRGCSVLLDGPWFDIGTPESLREGSQVFRQLHTHMPAMALTTGGQQCRNDVLR
jgi:dTDP-glucose pyrophosphorylase/beta-phosphoglucomutase-like phosphatase (HAD superfamily)